MNGRNAQVARIYRILNLLEGTPQGLSAAEIRERLLERDFDVSKRTIYRDLEALSDAGFPVFPGDRQSDEGATRWVLEKGRGGQSLALSARELFALYLARGLLVPLKDTPLHGDLEQVFRKIEDKLGATHRHHFAELSSEVRFEPAPTSRFESEVLETVRAACAEGQVLSVDYESANSGTRSRRRLGPHYVYFAKGSVYLIAEELATGETKVFALPRMSNALMEEEPYEGQVVDHEKFFASSFGVFHGKSPVPVRLEFSRAVAAFVRERRWHPSQKIVPRADGMLEVTMDVALTPELTQWILGFGADARVLEPEELKSRLGDSIQAMAEFYGAASSLPSVLQAPTPHHS